MYPKKVGSVFSSFLARTDINIVGRSVDVVVASVVAVVVSVDAVDAVTVIVVIIAVMIALMMHRMVEAIVVCV